MYFLLENVLISMEKSLLVLLLKLEPERAVQKALELPNDLIGKKIELQGMSQINLTNQRLFIKT